jgi:hypothetical protein
MVVTGRTVIAENGRSEPEIANIRVGQTKNTYASGPREAVG